MRRALAPAAGRLAGYGALLAEMAAGPPPALSLGRARLTLDITIAARQRLAAGVDPERVRREFALDWAALRVLSLGVRLPDGTLLGAGRQPMPNLLCRSA